MWPFFLFLLGFVNEPIFLCFFWSPPQLFTFFDWQHCIIGTACCFSLPSWNICQHENLVDLWMKNNSSKRYFWLNVLFLYVYAISHWFCPILFFDGNICFWQRSCWYSCPTRRDVVSWSLTRGLSQQQKKLWSISAERLTWIR